MDSVFVIAFLGAVALMGSAAAVSRMFFDRMVDQLYESDPDLWRALGGPAGGPKTREERSFWTSGFVSSSLSFTWLISRPPWTREAPAASLYKRWRIWSSVMYGAGVGMIILMDLAAGGWPF